MRHWDISRFTRLQFIWFRFDSILSSSSSSGFSFEVEIFLTTTWISVLLKKFQELQKSLWAKLLFNLYLILKYASFMSQMNNFKGLIYFWSPQKIIKRSTNLPSPKINSRICKHVTKFKTPPFLFRVNVIKV